MRAVEQRRLELATAAVALSVVLVFVLWLVLRIGGNAGVLDLDDIVTALAALSACLACASAAVRTKGVGRSFWVLLALALGAWTFAEIVWGFYNLVLHMAVPVPSWADVGYLGAIPLAAAALLCHPGMRIAGHARARATLDGLAIGTAVLLLSWTFVLGPLWRHTDLTTAGGIVAVAYPFGDMVIIFFIILSVRSMTALGRRSLLWVLVGLLAMAVSDSTYAYLVEANRYSTGNLVDVGWVVAYLAIAVGAVGDTGYAVRVSTEEGSEMSLTSIITPYVPVLSGLLVIAYEFEIHHQVDWFSRLTGLVLALLAMARQALVLVERRREPILVWAESNGPDSAGSGSQSPHGSRPEGSPRPGLLRRTP
jgi:hypothetical protein